MGRKCTATQAMKALEGVRDQLGETTDTLVLESYIFNGFKPELKLAELEAELLRLQIEKHGNNVDPNQYEVELK